MGIILYTLQRISQSETGTFGKLIDSIGKELCYTGELPWNDNIPQKSCIPAGIYQCIPHNSPKHPNTWEITEVTNRSEILFHNGNLPLVDSLGCILVGLDVGFLDGKPAVLKSNDALESLRNILPKSFILSIMDVNELSA